MDLVTEAFPVVAFAKQLEDKSRKIMEIMECVIQPDGSRQYNTLYPDNLKSKATLWLWALRDLAIIGIGSLISVFALSQLGFFVPIVLTAAYAFLSIRMDDTSILDFLRYAVRYFLLQQQSYSWGMTKTIQNKR